MGADAGYDLHRPVGHRDRIGHRPATRHPRRQEPDRLASLAVVGSRHPQRTSQHLRIDLGDLLRVGGRVGPFPGALALGVNFGGILGRLYAEAIENVDPKPLEALRATGAGRVQTILFAVLPQVLPQIVSYNLYWFEVGVRSATVLGMIGAGGIGFELVTTIRLYDFRQTSAILLVILGLVTLIDQASALLRSSIVK